MWAWGALGTLWLTLRIFTPPLSDLNRLRLRGAIQLASVRSSNERTDVALVYGFNCWLITCRLFVFVLHLCTNTTFAIGKATSRIWFDGCCLFLMFSTTVPSSQPASYMCGVVDGKYHLGSLLLFVLSPINRMSSKCRQILIGWKRKCNALRGGGSMDGWADMDVLIKKKTAIPMIIYSTYLLWASLKKAMEISTVLAFLQDTCRLTSTEFQTFRRSTYCTVPLINALLKKKGGNDVRRYGCSPSGKILGVWCFSKKLFPY